jgi:tRNA(Ile)-lysidine synthase
MRWRFLRSVAARRGATIVTAHTRDDQIETIVMRALRGASARGLAALYAASPTLRPLLDVSRATLERYARAHAVEFVEDPTNADRRFLRNRVRHDLLPGIRAVCPRFEREILSLARRAARLRRRTEQIARTFSSEKGNGLAVDVSRLAPLSADSLRLLWPAFVARLGVPLDRRGVERATQFTLSARVGQNAHCAGGIILERARGSLVISRRRAARIQATVELGQTVEFGEWRLRQVTRAAFAARPAEEALWGAAIARSQPCTVRSWQQGDRIRAAGQSLSRRVKRYFRELAIPVSDRSRWPVVVGGNEVLWVPGVCVSGAAVEHPGAQTTYFVCERHAG